MSSLSHILGPTEPDEPQAQQTSSAPPAAAAAASTLSPVARSPADEVMDDQPAAPQPPTSASKSKAKDTASVYSGNKLRHLKKEDGIPLWRKDIQFDFLRLVFEDKTRCFTKYSDGTDGHTFAEVYIDAMAKSTKCSRILREKLLQDHQIKHGVPSGAISMAMVCLLVNVGRMNTTLNFFPEMRAQLRTYHSIPALQAHQDPNAYKQLQDAPRLKSILKGATEDSPQPSSPEEMKNVGVPRTNPVNLVFVLSNYAPKINEMHFTPPGEFHDLVMRSSLSSASRAKAFLWLCWWYLEGDFSLEASLKNPFGPGEYGEGEEGSTAIPLKVPTLESLTEEQATLENVDTEEEQRYGESKRKERIAILASEPSPAMVALKRARKEKGLATYSDDDSMADVTHGPRTHGGADTASERTRSPSPVPRGGGFQAVNTQGKINGQSDMRINTLLNNEVAIGDGPSVEETPPVALAPVKKGPGRGNWRRKKPDASATSQRAADGGATTHHVPLLPANAQSQFGFVAETPGSSSARPGTPGSVQGTGHPGNHHLASSTAGSPARHSGLTAAATGGGTSKNADHVPTPSYQAQKRSRGITQHQTAIIHHRRQQIDYLLDRRLRRFQARRQELREAEGPIWRAWKRLKLMPPDYDSEEEFSRSRKARDRVEHKDEDWKSAHKAGKEPGAGAVVELDVEAEGGRKRRQVLFSGFARVDNESSDAGEEAKTMMKAIHRVGRRLERWQDERTPPGRAILRRKELQGQGLLGSSRRPLPVQALAMEQDSLEIVEPRVRSRPKLVKRQSSMRSRRGERRLERSISAARAEPMDEDDDGGGELDEEERELLGEVDADEGSSDEGSDGD